MPRTLRLKAGRDRSVRAGHPWIFSGAIESLDPEIEPGEIVDIESATGDFLARGYVNPGCSIAVRVLTRRDEAIDPDFVSARLRAALEWRRRCVPQKTTAYRLIGGEGDGLPGFVVDVYGEFAVLQALTAGAERLKPALIDALRTALPLRGIYERSSGGVRREEGLASVDVAAWGDEPPEVVEFLENGHRLVADLRAGQKTGFYLDQRPNREIAQRFASGARVLNAFAYTGSFAIYAAAGGASRVVSVESSASALALAERSGAANGLAAGAIELVREDVFAYLRRIDELFDLIVLDPPALVKHRRDLNRGLRSYKDANLHALRRLAPGGLLMTFTCSQHVSAELFRKVVQGAALDAGSSLQLVQTLGPGLDHPVALAHPEGEYLHGLLLRSAG